MPNITKAFWLIKELNYQKSINNLFNSIKKHAYRNWYPTKLKWAKKQDKTIRSKWLNTKKFKDWWSKQSTLVKNNKSEKIIFKGLSK